MKYLTKNRIASANNTLSNEIIKLAVEVSLHFIFKNYFPSPWSKGIIVPIYKSGSNIDPNN